LKSVSQDEWQNHKIVLRGHTKGKGGNPGAEITIILNGVYSPTCLLKLWAASENRHLESEIRAHQNMRNMLGDGVKEMEEYD